MDFYEKKRRAKIELDGWLKKVNRTPFSQFANNCFDTYGFDAEFMRKNILKKAYPELDIVDDQPKKTVKKSE